MSVIQCLSGQLSHEASGLRFRLLNNAIASQFEPLVGIWVLHRVLIDEFLIAPYGVYAAYVGCSAVEVVFSTEEDVIRRECKEDGWYLPEAVSDCKDIDHILSCS